jgi:GH15 family glucan-1,4-alpha-glucosidase
LNPIVTEDKTWIHHYNPDTNTRICSGSTIISLVKGILNIAISWKGYIYSVLDFEGSVLEHYQERGTMVMIERYCDMIGNELKPVICLHHAAPFSQSPSPGISE